MSSGVLAKCTDYENEIGTLVLAALKRRNFYHSAMQTVTVYSYVGLSVISPWLQLRNVTLIFQSLFSHIWNAKA